MDIEAEGTGRTNIINHKEITVNKVKDEKRKIVFRDDSYSVDSKSRFAGIVNEIPLDADALRTALKDAIKNSKKNEFTSKNSKPSAPVKETPTAISEPDYMDEELPFDEEEKEDIDDTVDETRDYPEDLADTIRTMFKECTDKDVKADVKKVITEYGKLNDVDEEGLKKIYDMMKG